jgi:predicted transcriptional regulator
MKILLSIKPKYAARILDGTKRYEYRKRPPKNQVFLTQQTLTVLLYATKPVGLVVGEFEILDIVERLPLTLWSMTKDGAGITREEYLEYFQHLGEPAYALHVLRYERYGNPLTLKDLGIKRPPLSFMYIE